MASEVTTVKVSTETRDALKRLADGRPLGVVVDRLARAAGGSLPELVKGAKESTGPAGGGS